jgi:ribosome-associated toxin RatA of RatAB toxin-antitoxin module
MSRRSSPASVLALLTTILFGCRSGEPKIDWSAPENLFAVEKTEKNEDGSTRLEFHSLVDAPADKIYAALAEPDNYAAFVEGVTESGKIATTENTMTTYITQKVIGRQNRAKVKWTFHPEQRRIEFETLESDLNYNDGWYQIYASPDGKRSYVVSVYNLRLKGRVQAPPGVAATATREAFKAAANSVKARALGRDRKPPG